MRKRFPLALLLALGVAVGIRNPLAHAAAPQAPDKNPEGNTGALKSQIETAGSYDAHSGNGTRVVTDLQVPGAKGDYGLTFTRYWNSVRNDDEDAYADWPMDFGASGWSHSWKWTARESHDIVQLAEGGGVQGEQIWTTGITITFPDGHATKYKITRSNVVHPPQPWPADGHWGAPYYATHGESKFYSANVHDFLENMAENGSDFWLHRADGGSVHFTGGPGVYQATEIFDSHGLRTELLYDQHGYLYQVKQDGGRWLNIFWGTYTGQAAPMISRVETGGYAGSQRVIYRYSRFPDPYTGAYALAAVGYPNDPAPGQTAWASYVYGTLTGSSVGDPLLMYASDPRYAGAMTRIHYSYQGTSCPNPAPGGFNRDYFPASGLALASEDSAETGLAVSSFSINCFDGTRLETNGLNGWRKFYFGSSAGPQGSFHCLGYQLAKLTDYSNQYPLPSTLPFERQNYMGGHPREIWDGWGYRTESLYQDASGSPTEVRFPDGNKSFYNRTDSSGSAAPDPNRIHNPYPHWLFSKKDENGNITAYRRDARRRVTKIEYEDTSFEIFEYDNGNPDGVGLVTKHRLPSGAVETYEYEPVTGRLLREYNDVQGYAERKEYTYDALERVETVRDGRAIADGVPYTTKYEYNGRHQIIKIHHCPTGHSPDPTVSYEYDSFGNRTAVIDEMGHRKEYTYDSYRRLTSQTEWVNGPGPDGNNVATRRWDWIYDRDIEGVGMRGPSVHTSKEWRVQIEPAFNASGDRRMTARTFDVNNRIISEQTGWIQPAGPIGPNNPWYQGPDIETHRFAYDKNGQKSSYTDPRGRVTTYEYNNRNRLWKTNETVNSLPRTTETLYDPVGNRTVVKFPENNGVVATQQWPLYTAFGQPRQFIDERGTSTELHYFPWGPMKKLAQVITHRQRDDGPMENQMTEFFPTLLGQPWLTRFPDLSTEETTYRFGLVSTFKTRKNQVKTISYDGRGREYSHVWSDGTPGVTRAWDDANRVLSLTNRFSAIDYGYDDAGQVTYEGTHVVGSGARKVVSYWRYPNGDVAQVTYPSGLAIRRSYTSRGQLKTVQESSGQQLASYQYLQDGKLEFQDSGNGVRAAFGYDERGFVGSISHERNSMQLSKRTYWRDKRDRITAWEKGVNPNGVNPRENGRGDRYKYDEAGQLERASYQAVDAHDTAGTPERTDDFHYDEMGNRKGWNWVASRGLMWMGRRDNGLNQYRSWENNYPSPPQHWGVVMWYDDAVTDPPTAPWLPPAKGVLMGDGWNVAGFNALNQPSSMWSFDYQGTANWLFFGYDPLGRCVKRWVSNSGDPATTNATFFYYDGWNLLQGRFERHGGGPHLRAWRPGGRDRGERAGRRPLAFPPLRCARSLHHADQRKWRYPGTIRV